MSDPLDYDETTLDPVDEATFTLTALEEPTANPVGISPPGVLDALTDFINFGVSNGNFRKGPPDPSSNITPANSTVASNFVPDWRFVQSSNTNITASHVRDATSPSGSNLRFTFASGAAGDEAFVEQLIDIGGSASFGQAEYVHFTLKTGAANSSGLLEMFVRVQYLTTDGAVVGMPPEAERAGPLAAGTTLTQSIGSPQTDVGVAATARYLRLRLGVKRGSAANSATGTFDFVAVRRSRTQVSLNLAEIAGGAPRRVVNDSGELLSLSYETTPAKRVLTRQLVAIPFVYIDMPAGATTELNPWDNAANFGATGARVEMPWSGSIVGMSYRITDAPTAGTFTLRATVNGSNVWSPFGAVGVGGAQSDSATQSLTADTFVAGDVLGIDCVTTAGYLPTTRDFHAVLWVAINYDGT